MKRLHKTEILLSIALAAFYYTHGAMVFAACCVVIARVALSDCLREAE